MSIAFFGFGYGTFVPVLLRMMKTCISFLIAYCLAFIAFPALGQGGEVDFTDYRPVYRKWKDIYILDKIEYREERMVLFFRFVDDNGGWATFYGPGKDFAWLLQDTRDRTKRYELLEIRNIRMNDTLKIEHLGTDQQVRYDTRPGDILTCEIHFDRLPIGTRRIHLIEGEGQETNENHFNCFDIHVKPSKSTDLGTDDDMERRIEDFASPEKADAVPELLPLTNQLRKKHGFCSRQRVPASRPLEWDERLSELAKELVLRIWRGEQDGNQQLMATDKGSRTIIERLNQRGYKTRLAYETLVFDAATPEEAFQRWKKVGSHCMRMRDGRLRAMGAARKGQYWLMIVSE